MCLKKKIRDTCSTKSFYKCPFGNILQYILLKLKYLSNDLTKRGQALLILLVYGNLKWHYGNTCFIKLAELNLTLPFLTLQTDTQQSVLALLRAYDPIVFFIFKNIHC